MKKTMLKKYAKLIVDVGANVQKGQDVIIYAKFDQIEFVTFVVEYCYKRKANSVHIEWSDDRLTKLAYKYRSVTSLSAVPDWVIKRQEHLVVTNPSMIYLLSDDPDGLKGINQEKMAKVRMNTYPIYKPFKDQRENKYQWCIAGVPGAGWAKKVFPNLSKNKAIEELWKAILKTSHADGDDPILGWTNHNHNLKNKIEKLNSMKIEYLHYISDNGTNFKVWLNPEALWLAGSEETLLSRVEYSPNIPSEECFTTPIKGKAEGIVYSSKPLSYQGQLIKDFYVKFENGKVVEAKAKENEALLKQMVSMDEGASYLGEVALVPFDSPINNTGILFFNTLYDENASCHLALGAGFSNCIKNYEKYTKDDFKKMGVNDSMIHVDFMIGTKDLHIVGHCFDGKDIDIFKNGNWAI